MVRVAIICKILDVFLTVLRNGDVNFVSVLRDKNATMAVR